MEKLKITIEPLLGSPLSDEELKNTIGGQMRYSRTCTCIFTFKEGGSGSKTEIIDASTPENCQLRCEELFKSNSSYLKYSYEFVVTG